MTTTIDYTTLRGRDLYMAVLDYIKANRRTWSQSFWRCFWDEDSKRPASLYTAPLEKLDRCTVLMCFAARTCDLTGCTWLLDYRHGRFFFAGQPIERRDIPPATLLDLVLATEDDDTRRVYEFSGHKVIPAAQRARRLLELPYDHGVFDAARLLPDLKRLAAVYYAA